MIDVKGLQKNYGGLQVLKGVDLTINKGDCVVLVGPSGCGKSTFLRCLNRLEQPSSGRVFIDGEEITAKKAPLDKIRRKMGMVYQTFNLFSHKTILENVMMAPMQLGGLSKKEAYELAMDCLSQVGMAERADYMPQQLSGGQKQRIAIVRALAMKPKLMLFDEPTSALDVSIQAQILNILNDLRKELGLTILFIAHDLSVVKYFSNRVAVMNAGRIVEMSSSDEIYRDPQHAYTKSLLSAIPVPDPLVEKKRQRIHYDKASGVYQPEDNPLLREIKPGHFVLMSDNEWAAYQKANA